MSEHEPLQPLSESQREALEEATASYQEAVTGDAARWLVARGIDRATAATFRLGVVGDPMPGHERFRGMLAIPYLDRAGAPLQLRFRCFQDHEHRDFFHGKYNSVAGDPVRIFNVRAVHEAKDVISVTEGEFDAMILEKIGLRAVAVPGANLWRPHFRRVLAGFSRIHVWGDPDEAGADFTNKVTRSLRQAKGMRLRDGDVTDIYKRDGAIGLLSLVGEEAAA